MIYCVDETANEPIMLINTHIGFDEEDGQGVDGALFQRELLYLDSLGKKRIQIWINSIGGSMMEGFNIASAILKTKTPVDTYNTGMCISMAGIIFMCGRNRIMMDYSQFMMHPVQGANDKKMNKSFSESASALLSGKADITQEQVADLMKETTWLNAEQCLEKGFCTEIEKTTDINKKRLSTTNVDNFIKEANLITNKLINPKTIKNKKSMLKVTNKLGLNEDANEESILRAIQDIENKATSDKAKLQEEMDALKKEIADKQKALEDMKNVMDGLKEDNCKNMVSGFATIGKIANEEEVVNKWVALAKNDFDGTKSILESLPLNKQASTIDVKNQNVDKPLGSYIHERIKEVTNKHN
jgi:ATP-dependent protease ClpP protease subunit